MTRPGRTRPGQRCQNLKCPNNRRMTCHYGLCGACCRGCEGHDSPGRKRTKRNRHNSPGGKRKKRKYNCISNGSNGGLNRAARRALKFANKTAQKEEITNYAHNKKENMFNANWSCLLCTFLNSAKETKCKMCTSAKPVINSSEDNDVSIISISSGSTEDFSDDGVDV